MNLWSLYTLMAKSRRFEETVTQLWNDGLISGEMHLGTGEEAIIAGVVSQLRPGDAMAVDHRGTAALTLLQSRTRSDPRSRDSRTAYRPLLPAAYARRKGRLHGSLLGRHPASGRPPTYIKCPHLTKTGFDCTIAGSPHPTYKPATKQAQIR